MFHIFAGFLLGFVPALLSQAAPAKSSGVWLDVPYVKQTEDGCGSAAIAMLLQYWSAHGTPVRASQDAAAIQKQLYSRKARGIFAADMEQYFRGAGFREGR
jgi:predicted double-glycine peptidase